VALGGSAIAGVATGTFDAVPTSARANALSAWIVPGSVQEQAFGTPGVVTVTPASFEERDGQAINGLMRPEDLRFHQPAAPVSDKKRRPRKLRPHHVKAHVAPVPTTTVPTTTVPPTTVPPTTVPPTTVADTAPAGGVWYELRMCESDGDYSINTGNGFYGAYQFALSAWLGLGFTGLPSAAPPAVQDRAAQELQARSGWGQWPACSAKLGL
jgi:hypothetical protein